MNRPRPMGVHDQTFVLRRLIELRGEAAPPSEAWLLGVGGGIGFQSFTFEYRDTPPVLFVGTRCAHQYAYDVGFLARAAGAVGFALAIEERGGRKKAAAALDAALARGPVVAWVGLESLYGMQAPMGDTPWVVLVRERSGDDYILEDVYCGELRVGVDALSRARKALKKARNRVLTLVPSEAPSPREVVRDGIRQCVAELEGAHAVGSTRKSFGLSALARWAKQADSTSKKGWRKRFSAEVHLLCGLRQAYGWIERATGGGAFRPLYATFLRDAARVTDEARLAEAAELVAENGRVWSELATWMLDPAVPMLAQCRAELDAAAWPEPMASAHAWCARSAEIPADWAESFYPELARRLVDLHAREVRAKDLLEGIVGRAEPPEQMDSPTE